MCWQVPQGRGGKDVWGRVPKEVLGEGVGETVDAWRWAEAREPHGAAGGQVPCGVGAGRRYCLFLSVS